MKASRKLLIILTLSVNLLSAQSTTRYVTNSSWTGVNSITDALNWANSYPSGSGTLRIEIQLNSPSYIDISTNLPAIQLQPNNNLVITTSANTQNIPYFTNFLGFRVTSAAVAYGFAINTQTSPNTNYGKVTLTNLLFSNFTIVPHFQLGNGIPCYFAPCIIAEHTSEVNITNCTFTDYASAINYNVDVGKMNILYNTFNVSIITSVYGCDYNWPDNPHIGIELNTTNGLNPTDNNSYQSVISNNIFQSTSNAPVTATGILINPVDSYWPLSYNLNPYYYPMFSWTTQYDVRADIKIDHNIITNHTEGILVKEVPPVRSSPDLTYKLAIEDNSISARLCALQLCSPYRHFSLKRNNIGTYYSTYYGGVETPCLLFIGSNNGIWNFSNIFGGAPAYLWPNAFGLDLVNTGNPANDNTFSHQNLGSASTKPYLVTFGNFDDISPSGNAGVILKKLDLPGSISIGEGKSTSISQCSLESADVTFSSPIKAQTQPTVILVNSFYYNGGYKGGNKLISPPNIQDIYLTPALNVLKIALDLSGNEIIQPNGPFLLEFFKSNSDGDLVSFIGDQYINTLTGLTYTISLPINSSVPINFGDKIAVTLTSLGTNSTPKRCIGTSEPSYVDLEQCPTCLSTFAPTPGKKYTISAWVKIPGINSVIYSYDTPGQFATPVIKVSFHKNFSANPQTFLPAPPLILRPSGPIIEGWQKIESEIEIPLIAKGILLEACADYTGYTGYTGSILSGKCLFDDIRFFPSDGTMKSYAYDKNSLRLSAELDENNYATFYEYDEEGKLIRVKKETERGIMTIKESRNNKPIK